MAASAADEKKDEKKDEKNDGVAMEEKLEAKPAAASEAAAAPPPPELLEGMEEANAFLPDKPFDRTEPENSKRFSLID